MPARWHFLIASGTFGGGGTTAGRENAGYFLAVRASLLDVKLLQLPEVPAPFLLY